MELGYAGWVGHQHTCTPHVCDGVRGGGGGGGSEG